MGGFAISGKAGTGKTTLAAALTDELRRQGYESSRFAFSDAVKAELFRQYGLQKGDPGAREKLIEIGDGKRREIPGYWIHLLERELVEAWRHDVLTIVDDVRYPDELKATRSRWGLVTIRCEASWSTRASRLANRGEPADFASSKEPSECALDMETNWHYYVDTDDSCVACTARRIVSQLAPRLLPARSRSTTSSERTELEEAPEIRVLPTSL